MKPYALSDLAARYQEQVVSALAPRLRDAKPKQDAGLPPLRQGEDEKRSPVRARVRISCFRSKLLDPDNCAGAVKFVLDACRYDNLIPSDDPASIILEVYQFKVPKEERGTLIEITPL